MRSLTLLFFIYIRARNLLSNYRCVRVGKLVCKQQKQIPKTQSVILNLVLFVSSRIIMLHFSPAWMYTSNSNIRMSISGDSYQWCTELLFNAISGLWPHKPASWSKGYMYAGLCPNVAAGTREQLHSHSNLDSMDRDTVLPDAFYLVLLFCCA